MAEKLSAKSAWKLNNALKKSAATKPTKVGTARVTRRDSDGSVWVRLPGSNVDTPVNGQILSDAQVGDTVSVRIENGRLSLMGNASTPSVGQQQVNTTVQPVRQTADNALETASTAQAAAELATSYAAAAQQSATDAETYARQALGSAQDADRHATEAKADALAANTAAQGALLGLSTVEDVVDTLTWITKHGTMTLTSDTQVDPSKVYFVADASGQYVVGGSSYSIVQNPTTEGLSTYYELTIDKSVENYIATHVAVTNEGLWLTPTSSNGYRVLIATGAGSTYTTAGTYIIDNNGNVRAVIGETITLGGTGESHVELDADSLNFVSGNSVPLVTMRIDPDSAQYWEATFTSDGTTSMYTVANEDRFAITPGTMTGYAVTVDGERTNNGYIQGITTGGVQYINGVWFSPGTIPEAGVEIVLSVTAAARASFIVGAGRTNTLTNVGNNTIIAGAGSSATGDNSIAAGSGAGASGKASAAFGGSRATADYAFAAGQLSEADGQCSTALGYSTLVTAANAIAVGNGLSAESDNQAVFGKLNVKDTNGDYALIVGNGTDGAHRSNAFAVGWDGSVDVGGYVRALDSRFDAAASSLSENVYLSWGMMDELARYIMFMQAVEYTSGMTAAQIAARKVVNDANVDNALSLRVANDGTRSVVVSDQAAWRTGLGIGGTVSTLWVQGNSASTSGTSTVLPTAGTYLLATAHNSTAALNGLWMVRTAGNVAFKLCGGASVTVTVTGQTVNVKTTAGGPNVYYMRLG